MDEEDADASPLPLLMGKRGAAGLDPRPKGSRPVVGPDPRPKGRRPAAEPDLAPAGKRLAPLLDPWPMEEEALPTPTLPLRPAVTLNGAAAAVLVLLWPDSGGVLGLSISLVSK